MSADRRAKTRGTVVSQELFTIQITKKVKKKGGEKEKGNKIGFTAIMSKHKASLNNGSQKHHSDAKYYGKFDQSW